MRLSFLIAWIQRNSSLAQAVPEDKQQLLMQEIQLLTVRERRMLNRIESASQRSR